MSTPPTVHGLLASLVRGRPRAGTGGVAFPGAAVQRAPPAGAALTHARDDENRLQAENRDDESPPKRRKTAVALDLEDDDDDDESDPEDCDQGGAGTEVGATAAADVNDDDGAGRQGGSPGTHLAALLGRRSPGAQAGGLFARPQNASAAADGGLRTVREENEDQAEADDNGHAVAGSLRARPGATSEADEQPAPPGAEDAGATEDAGAPLASALRRYMSTIARETHEALVAIVNDAELSMLHVCDEAEARERAANGDVAARTEELDAVRRDIERFFELQRARMERQERIMHQMSSLAPASTDGTHGVA